MTRWFARIAVLVSSAVALVYVAAVAALARPVPEHVGSAVVVDGAPPAPEQPMQVVQSGGIPNWAVMAGVLIVVVIGAALMIRTAHGRHVHAA